MLRSPETLYISPEMPLEQDGFSSSDQAIKVTVMLWLLIRVELRWLYRPAEIIDHSDKKRPKIESKIRGAKMISLFDMTIDKKAK